MEYIFPNPNEKICILKVIEKKENIQCGEKFSMESTLYKKVMEELEFSFHQSVIKLNQCTRNLIKDHNGPNVLLLSQNEGGYANCGLSLSSGNERIDYPKLNYVDLVIDEERLQKGDLQIFTHELGHVMMANILKNFPESKASKQHVSMGITDYFMAFNEGWAIHFERLSYDLIEHYRDLIDSKYGYDRDIIGLWQCEADTELRLNGILKNNYVNRKLLPPIQNCNMDIKDTIILEHTSTIFDKTKLKNAQEMLSCEGVIATLFYRINTNTVLQNNYMPKEFYNNFLISNIGIETSAQQLFSPFENVVLKNFWVWNKINLSLSENSIPFVEFIKTWCKCFPQDKSEIIKLFVSTTVGKTISNELSDIYEKAAYSGMIGNVQDFIEHLNKYKQANNALCKMLENDDTDIGKNIGRELWIENRNVKMPKYFWLGDEMLPLKINLNTASIYDLMSFPKIDLPKATEILELRTRKGFFKSIEEVGEDYFN